MTDDEPPPLPAPPAHPSRLVYLGTPELAVPPLRALCAAGHDVALVVSRVDKRRGRGSQLQPSPVKAAALELGLRVSDQLDDVLDVGADLGVVVAYGRIIPRRILERLPMVNLHFSLLPRWRGAAPVERAILAGDPETGVDLMAVEEGLDTGSVYAEERLAIGADESLDDLRGRLVDAGTGLLCDVLRDGLGHPQPQTGEVTYAEKVAPEELHIDWAAPAVQIHRTVRLGGAWTTFRDRRLKIWQARPVTGEDLDAGELALDGGDAGVRVGTGEGVLALLEVQPEGKGRQDAAAWRNGARPAPGERLG